MISHEKRKENLADLIEDLRNFKICGPSDDLDQQTAVTLGCHFLLIKFQKWAAPILSSSSRATLEAISAEINDLNGTYNALAELDALVPEIEDYLQRSNDDIEKQLLRNGAQIISDDRLVELREILSDQFDFKKLIRLCEEVNIAYSQQCYFSTTMLVRGILDHIPPVLNCKNFNEVANNYVGGGRSFKESMQHLDKVSRKIADMHLHQSIRKSETLPTEQQVNCGQMLDLLLAEIVRISRL